MSGRDPSLRRSRLPRVLRIAPLGPVGSWLGHRRDDGFASGASARGALGWGSASRAAPGLRIRAAGYLHRFRPAITIAPCLGRKGQGHPPFLHLTFGFAFDMLKWSIKFGAVKTL